MPLSKNSSSNNIDSKETTNPQVSDKECAYNGASYEDFSKEVDQGIQKISLALKNGEIKSRNDIYHIAEDILNLRISVPGEIESIGILEIIKYMDFVGTQKQGKERRVIVPRMRNHITISRGSALAKVVQLLAFSLNSSSQFEHVQESGKMFDGRIGVETKNTIERVQIKLKNEEQLNRLKNDISGQRAKLEHTHDLAHENEQKNYQQDYKIYENANDIMKNKEAIFQSYEQSVKGIFSEAIINMEEKFDGNNHGDSYEGTKTMNGLTREQRRELTPEALEFSKQRLSNGELISRDEIVANGYSLPNNIEIDAESGQVEIRTYGNLSTFNLKTGTITVFPKDGEPHQLPVNMKLNVDDDHTLLKGLPMLGSDLVSKRNSIAIKNAMRICNLTNMLISHGGDIANLINEKEWRPYSWDENKVGDEGLIIGLNEMLNIKTFKEMFHNPNDSGKETIITGQQFSEFMNTFFERRYYETPDTTRGSGNHREF